MGAESCRECRATDGHKLNCGKGAGPIEIPVMVPRPVNPDCVQGKHRACAGDAWDVVRDELTACGCGCHEEETP